MSNTGETTQSIMEGIERLIQSFLHKTTNEQWELFTISRLDDATTIQVAELIVEIIATLSTSVATTLRSQASTSVEHILSNLEETLSKAILEALGIQGDKPNDNVKTLTAIIHREVRENLNSSQSRKKKITTNQRITPTCRINAMIFQFVEIFKRFSGKIKSFIRPRLHGKKVKRVPSSEEKLLQKDCNLPIGEGIKKDMHDEFRDIFSPLIVDIPEDEYVELQQGISEELETVAEDISAKLETKTKKRAVKCIRKKIKLFFAKCFAKISLMRIFAKLKKKYPKHIGTCSDSVEMILENISNQFVEQEDQESPESEFEEALVQLFSNVVENKVSDFNQELSDLIYYQMFPGEAPCILDGELQSEVQGDISREAWCLVALMCWFLNDQVDSIIDRVTLPYMDISGMSSWSTPVETEEEIAHREAEQAKNRAYVNLVVQKITFILCSDAKVLPLTMIVWIDKLSEVLWEEVKDKQFHTDAHVFMNLERRIRKLLYKVSGHPEKVLFRMLSGDTTVIDQIRLIITKTLLTPRKEKSLIQKAFCSLANTISKAFKPKEKKMCVF